jgi:serine/threonine protein kinase
MNQIGKYVVVRELGRGGMGVVYEARDPALDRAVALKFVNEQADPKRFLVEAKAAAKVIHPNLVPIFDLGEHDGRPFLVMELIDGTTAAEFLAKRGPLSWKTATRIVAAACRGLAAVHDAGLIHRDIKPSNLLISNSGVVKVADFGLARLVAAGGPSLTGDQIVGTPHYMSPEQCLGEPVDTRSDVYALGVTYFVLLTGHTPYSADRDLQILFAHCNDPIPDPRTVVPAVPATCAEVIRKAMAKRPADRYQSAREVLTALDPILAADRTEELAVLSDDYTPPQGTPLASTRMASPQNTLPEVIPSELLVKLPGSQTPQATGDTTVGSGNVDSGAAPSQSKDSRLTRRRFLLAIPPAVAALSVGGYFAFRSPRRNDGGSQPPPLPALVPVRNVGGTVRAVAVSDDGRWLAVGLGVSNEHPEKALFGVKLYDRTLGVAPEVWWKWPDADCWGVAFQNDSKLLAAAGGATGEVLVWSLEDQKPLYFASATLRGNVRSVAFSLNGAMLAAGVQMSRNEENLEQPGVVRVWDVSSRGKLHDLVHENHPVRQVAFASDSKTLAASMEHGVVNVSRCEVWDAAANSLVKSLPALQAVGGPSIAFARSTLLLAVGAKDDTALYRPPWTEPLRVQVSHDERPGAVALNPDGSLLAVAVRETISLWDTSTGIRRGKLGEHKGLVHALAFTADGRTLISGGEDRTVREYSMPTSA